MKAKLMAVWGFVWLASITGMWGGTAQVQLANNSLKMFPGPCSCGFGLVWNLHFSTIYTEDPLQANGELLRRPPGSPTTHWAYMLLEDPSMYSSVTLVELDLPMGDFSGNGIPDFFELGQEVAAATSGVYQSSLGGGTLTLSWTRAAGSAQGSCILYMNDRVLGQIGPFIHTFEVLEYGGTLDYKRTEGSSSATIDLRRGSDKIWGGSIQLVRAASDPLNTLTLQAGVWTNATGAFAFEETTLSRDPSRPSAYQGTVSNPTGDFRSWTIQIVDPNDSNGNGIPDLSDDLAIQPPRAPSLAMRKVGNRLELVVGGDTGRLHKVQAATSLTNPFWEEITSLVLTNDPQVLEISPPAIGSKFWRVEAVE